MKSIYKDIESAILSEKKLLAVLIDPDKFAIENTSPFLAKVNAYHAGALLFLSLLSGRNPEYLIEQQIKSVSKLRHSTLEVIPTGYILIESGKITAVEKVTKTKPIPRTHVQDIIDTAKAGELLGMKLIYLEAGSGAKIPLTKAIISLVKKELNIPLIVGGGIKSKKQLEIAYNSGANMVVIGTAFEDDESFFNDLLS